MITVAEQTVRGALQAQIDALTAELDTLPDEDDPTLAGRLDTLEAHVRLLAYLHAERDHHLLHAFDTVTQAINLLAWLQAEREHYLQLFIESEQDLRRRAQRVKQAREQAAQNGIHPAGAQP